MGSFFHRHPRLTPYLLLAPGIAWLGVFFLIPLGFLGYQSLESGTYGNFEFTWEFSNFTDAFSDYRDQLFRSFLYAGIATTAALLLSYPLVYWIAFRAGPWRNLFLLFIVAPFFVTYLVRTLAWLSILNDQGPVIGFLRDVHVLGADEGLLYSTFAVISGITYNFFPFMALPLYVSLEQIDPTFAGSRQGPVRELDPGVLARDPAALGSRDRGRHAADLHSGSRRLHQCRPPRHDEADDDRERHPGEVPHVSRLSDRGVAQLHPHGADPRRAPGIRARRRHGETHGMTTVVETVPRSPHQGVAARTWRFVKRHALTVYAILAVGYLILPIAVVVLFSFNAPKSNFNYVWQGFTLDNWIHWDAIIGIRASVVTSLEVGLLATIVATVLGTLIALAIVRHRFRGRGSTNLLVFLPMSTPEIVLGASLLTLFLNTTAVFQLGFVTIFIAHVMFIVSFVVVTVKARLIGFDRHLEEAAMDLGANEIVTFRKVTFPLIAPAMLAAALLGFALSIDDFVITFFNAGSQTQTFPIFVWTTAQRGLPPQINVVASAIFLVAIALALGNVLWQYRSAKRSQGAT